MAAVPHRPASVPASTALDRRPPRILAVATVFALAAGGVVWTLIAGLDWPPILLGVIPVLGVLAAVTGVVALVRARGRARWGLFALLVAVGAGYLLVAAAVWHNTQDMRWWTLGGFEARQVAPATSATYRFDNGDLARATFDVNPLTGHVTVRDEEPNGRVTAYEGSLLTLARGVRR